MSENQFTVTGISVLLVFVIADSPVFLLFNSLVVLILSHLLNVVLFASSSLSVC